MEKYREARLATIRSWGRHVMKELASVESLLARGIEFGTPRSPCETVELAAAVQPHLAVLVHKRAKFCRRDDAVDAVRWMAELSQFADRWPQFASTAEERNRLITELDRIVAAEQKRQVAERSAAMPVTSRFDSSWAM